VAVGVAELAIAIVLLAAGYWYSIFGTAPATALCAYFARKEWEKLGSDSGSSRSRSSR
jgi:membrane protein implicated in regulation of membrane protease activity